MHYGWRVALGLNYFLAALIGGRPHETISQRTFRNRDIPGWREFHRLLVWLDPKHFDGV